MSETLRSQGTERPPLETLPEAADHSKYPAGLAGYTGVSPNEIAHWTRKPAVRSRIGWRGLYKTGLAHLPNGDLLACPCYQADDGNQRITIFRSRDESKTWTQVETKGDELLGKEPALICLRDGAVLLLTSHPHGFRVSRSDDAGVTWRTTPIGDIYDTPKWVAGYGTVRSVFEQPDGALLMLMSKSFRGLKETSGAPTTPSSQAWLFRSSDGGHTWAEHKQLKTWDDPESLFDEASVVWLADGRILAACRISGDHQIGDIPPPRGIPTPEGDESGDHMVLTESSDGGITWSAPRPFLNYSEVHGHLLPLKDGRLLCAYASYHLPFGVFAILSEDGGITWQTEHPIQLAMSLSCYSGWPTSLQLPGGDIITAYAITAYLEGGGVSLTHPGRGDTVAEAVRWKLPPR